jgi:tRNA A-37 threonylcarbamoyl transferase component Bud32
MRIEINPVYQSIADFIHTIPDIFDSEGEVIYKGRNVLRRYSIGGLSLVVKRFKKPHVINKVVYSYFRKSKACRSYEHAFQLIKLGIGTPTPVAYIESYCCSMISYSYYISIESTAQTLKTLYSVPFEEKKEILKAFAQFASELHSKEVYHKDFTQGNILFEKDKEQTLFSLIDINRMSFGVVSKTAGYKNFCALWEQDASIAHIAKWYAYYRGFDEKETINKVMCYNRHFQSKGKSKLTYLLAFVFPKFLQS